MAQSALRRDVLSLYRKILRTAYKWEATVLNDTATERAYIRNEARQIFRANKNVTDQSEIKQHLQEGNARLELAIHYQNPYPRPTNFPQHMVTPYSMKMRGSKRKIKQSTPVYLKTTDQTMREKD